MPRAFIRSSQAFTFGRPRPARRGTPNSENEARSWEPIQSWLLELRRRGLAVLLVHHDGKGGAQRGTSKSEDILSQVVQFTRPADYSPAAGAQFEVHLRNARGVFGDAAQAFEAEYRTDENGRAVWAWKPIEDELMEQVLHLKRDKNFKQRQIRDALGIGLGTVSRRIKKLVDEGRLPPEDR